MVGTIKKLTPNFSLKIPVFNIATWHDAMEFNFTLIDALLGNFFDASKFKGPWKVVTGYEAEDVVYITDPDDEYVGKIFKVLEDHVTEDTTFAEYYAAHPNYYELLMDIGATATYFQMAKDYAQKTDGIVQEHGEDVDYSAKSYAIGGVGTEQNNAKYYKELAESSATSAQESAGDAEISKQNAEIYADNAIGAMNTAQQYRDAAEDYKDQAGIAASTAVSAKTSAQTSATTAQSAATSAESAKDLAQTAATSANNSATLAEGYANDASSSASSAESSASSASSSEQAAEQSAESAAQSAQIATDAIQTVTEKAQIATEQATIATNAATTATTQAITATTQAGIATTKASQASTAATNATTSETNAHNSEVAATSAANSAQTSADNALSSATIATTKASDATTSATNAQQSATDAQTFANNASTSAQNSLLSATNSATSANNSYVWAEGTDAEVQALGGEHSAKGWAESVDPSNYATKTELNTHVNDTSNPHNVTKAQIGLGSVPNVDTSNASNITSGTLNNARLDTIPYSKLSGVASSAQGNKADTATQPADLLSAINTHNTSETSHTDIRGLIATIVSYILSDTSVTNQLVNKSFVNSSIATNTANFIGTFDSVVELEAYSGTKTPNDYAFVQGTDSAGNRYFNRYKWTGTAWLYEFTLNNSSFTAAQWATINSAITAAKVTNYDNHLADTIIHVTSGDKTTWNNKQAALVSGTNIKTLNGSSILGGGNLTFATTAQGAKADTAVQPEDLNVYALDANVVHKSGTETVAGSKTFTSPMVIQTNTNKGFELYSPSSGGYLYVTRGGDTPVTMAIKSGSDGGTFGTVTNHQFRFRTNDTNRMTIGKDGSVKLEQDVASGSNDNQVATTKWVNGKGYQTSAQVDTKISTHNLSNSAHSDIRTAIAGKSTVSVSASGTATDEVQYITIDGVQKKLAGGGGGSEEDNLSITKNASDKIQAVGIIDQHNTSRAIKQWTGTKAQYDAIATKDANTLYNITDDSDLSLPILQTLYPVGSLYLTTNEVCPLASLFGTWSKVGTKILTDISGSNNVPVKGNGKTLGMTDGTNDFVYTRYVGSSGQGIAPLDSNLGTTHSSFGIIDKAWGIITDPTKSGIIADISNSLTKTELTVNIFRRTA